MSRLTSEPCLNDNAENERARQSDIFDEVTEQLLNNESVFAQFGAKHVEYSFCDVMEGCDIDELEKIVRDITIHPSARDEKAISYNIKLTELINVSARKLAARIIENGENYE